MIYDHLSSQSLIHGWHHLSPSPGWHPSSLPAPAAWRSFHSLSAGRSWGARPGCRYACQRPRRRIGSPGIWPGCRWSGCPPLEKCRRTWAPLRSPEWTPVCWETEAAPLAAQWSDYQCPQNTNWPGKKQKDINKYILLQAHKSRIVKFIQAKCSNIILNKNFFYISLVLTV